MARLVARGHVERRRRLGHDFRTKGNEEKSLLPGRVEKRKDEKETASSHAVKRWGNEEGINDVVAAMGERGSVVIRDDI